MSIRFAIVGCGRISERHAQHISNVGELVAVCDIVREKAEGLAEKYGAKAYTDLDEMLRYEKEVEVVAICSPNGLHAAQTIAALQAEKHVICEKPMAINPYDCGEMIKAAERANRRLFVVKQNRFNPPVAAVKELIDAGKLGQIYSVHLSCYWNRHNAYYANSWKGTKALDGGTLYTQFSHFIDLLYWMFGDVKEVTAYTANYHHQGIIEFEDTGVVNLRFYNGTLGSVHYTVNSYQKNMEGSLTIFGEKGTVKIGGQYLNELEYQQIEGIEIKDLPPGNPPNQYGNYVGSMSNHDHVYANLVQVLTNNGIIATNGFEGLKTVEIIDKIYTAAKPL
ncbi:putative dehydrogenase [Flammeovirgaceae bacterium 311]|nr:putative dehydrogenase [Flammeovirgaceae bacterium 311]